MHPTHPSPNSQDRDRKPETGTAAMANPGPDSADFIHRRQLEKTVSWTGPDRNGCAVGAWPHRRRDRRRRAPGS
jgi:hypothetical protein